MGAFLRTNKTFKNANLILHTLRGVGTPSTKTPKVEMRISDTDARTWTPWMEADLAGIGDYEGSDISVWPQLGSIKPPGRTFELRVTDDVEFTPYWLRYNERTQ